MPRGRQVFETRWKPSEPASSPLSTRPRLRPRSIAKADVRVARSIKSVCFLLGIGNLLQYHSSTLQDPYCPSSTFQALTAHPIDIPFSHAFLQSNLHGSVHCGFCQRTTQPWNRLCLRRIWRHDSDQHWLDSCQRSSWLVSWCLYHWLSSWDQ
jgi:hypothetical protein